MVKLKHKGLLVMGITKQEQEALRDGKPLPVSLEDLGLKGQMILLVPGEDNDSLKKTMEQVADAYQNGATSVIEIAKAVPNMGKRKH